MKKAAIIIPVLIVILEILSLTNCGYPERGHANTPAENPGSTVRTGVDTVAHPGNIDRDSIGPR